MGKPSTDRTEVLHSGAHLDFCRRGRWEFVRRGAVDEVVGVIAVTPAGELLLVEQHRPPLGENGMRVIELPAGLVGDDGSPEEMLTAARRELREETGYHAGRFELLTSGPSSPGLSSEVIGLALAHDLERRDTGGGVDGEDITVHHVPLDRAATWLAERQADGVTIDVKVWAGLYFALR
ncbi:MAG: NUDIX hydrolase [Planctomycetota bacterium]